MPFPAHCPCSSHVTILAMVALSLTGCGADSDTPQKSTQQEHAPTLMAPARRVSNDEGAITIAELRKQLGIGQAGQIRKVAGQIVAIDLRGTPVTDLTPLKGLPLRQLFIEDTRVSDLSPLSGMPLDQLYLGNTPVSDLSPLKGMQLEQLNLVGTAITDLSPLAEVEVGTLWIPQTKVSDLSPLSKLDIISLDVQETPVVDLSPLANIHSLRRLHIGGTQVTDLSPLAGRKLHRIILSPETITSGWDAIREMTTLTGLDTKFDGEGPVTSPKQFWERFDAGEWTQNENPKPPAE